MIPRLALECARAPRHPELSPAPRLGSHPEPPSWRMVAVTAVPCALPECEQPGAPAPAAPAPSGEPGRGWGCVPGTPVPVPAAWAAAAAGAGEGGGSSALASSWQSGGRSGGRGGGRSHPDPLLRAAPAGARGRGCIIDEGKGRPGRRQGPSCRAQPRAKHFACAAEPQSCQAWPGAAAAAAAATPAARSCARAAAGSGTHPHPRRG